MSKLSDNYPVGMSICDEYGLGGYCGKECPLFQEFKCKESSFEDQLVGNFLEDSFTKEEIEKLIK